MYTCCALLLALSISISPALSCNPCTSWWSLGIKGISQGEQLQPGDCQNMSCLCTTARKNICEACPDVIVAIAMGVRQGIVQCQEQFAKAKWNCTTFSGEYLFGKFVEEGYTRETAVIDAMLVAGANIALASACADDKISCSKCTCQISGVNGLNEDGEFITYGCSHDTVASREMLQEFLPIPTNCSDNATVNALHTHNYNFGINVSSVTDISCRCTGYSGSCSVQSCYYKTKILDYVGKVIREAYESALQVVSTTSPNGTVTLLPAYGNSPIINDLVFLEPVDAISFCEPDPARGILGTHDRSCNISSSAIDSCSVLCCGRGSYRVETRVPIEECKFVWCCEIVCTVVRYETVTNFYCR